MAQSNGLTPKRDEGIPILIPEESILEGYIKTKKSLKIESNFYGTLLSTQKVIIDVNSTVHGDVICAESIISGNFEGNIFCTGKIEVNGNARITGKVYTKLFQNEDTCDLNCIVQVPNNEIFRTIRELLQNIDSVTKLSADTTLEKIKELFIKNVYSYNKNAPRDKNIPGTLPKEPENQSSTDN